MKITYIALLAIVLLLIVFHLIKNAKNTSSLAVMIRLMMIVTIASVSANIVTTFSDNLTVSAVFFAIFYISIDWILYFMLKYVAYYVGHRPQKDIAIDYILLGILALDSVSLAMNVFTNHAFGLTSVEVYNVPFIIASEFYVAYYTHLGICYVIVIFILILLISKIIRTSKFYLPKYLAIFIAFMLVIVCDGFSVFLKLPVNLGIIFYGALATFISYYSLSYVPMDLVNTTVKLAVENLDSGIICFDIEGKCAFTNESIWRIFQSDPNEKRAEEMFVERTERYHLHDVDYYRWTEKNEIRDRVLYLECEYHKMYDDGKHQVGYYFHIQDITQRIAEYEEQIRKAEAESRAKSEFVSKISHEIRTPINSVYGMNEMILRECKDPQILDYANDIKNSTEIMVAIVNDVLDYGKIESGKMELINETYSLKKLLDSIDSMIRSRTRGKSVEFRIEYDPKLPSQLEGDVVRVEQILINLLTNAVKYTNEGSVVLSVTGNREGAVEHLHFSVKDTGIGIRKEDISKLFVAYERLDEMKHHSIQGTGLGLNIVSQLLNLMDSKLQVESEYGRGSEFYFDLDQTIINANPIEAKVDESSHKSVITDAISDDDYSGKSILIVDDNAINRKVIRGLLKHHKLTIAEADGGEACLKMVQLDHFALIFLDHMMPEKDGVETFQEMRRMEEYPCKDTPVVMLTANAVFGARDKYLSLGFDEFLAKPVIPTELENIIKQFL